MTFDTALRRRFHFHGFFPDRDPINGMLHRFLQANHPDLAWVADIVDAANNKLDDRNLAIGPSHFMRKELTGELVDQIWRYTVLPFMRTTSSTAQKRSQISQLRLFNRVPETLELTEWQRSEPIVLTVAERDAIGLALPTAEITAGQALPTASQLTRRVLSAYSGLVSTSFTFNKASRRAGSVSAGLLR